MFPPNKRAQEVLTAERVCQAKDGPFDVEEFCEPLTYCQGGEVGSKEEEKERKRRSLFQGAEVYEYWLYWSVFPPNTKNASLTSATAWPHLRTNESCKPERISQMSMRSTHLGTAE